jgi:hypothetical protein
MFFAAKRLPGDPKQAQTCLKASLSTLRAQPVGHARFASRVASEILARQHRHNAIGHTLILVELSPRFATGI